MDEPSAGRSRTAPSAPGGAGAVLARLSRQLDRALAEIELSAAQYRVLGFLAEQRSAAAASALADRLAVSRPSVTALVDGLVARGLVERRADACDRRRVGHVLTPAGHDALRRADAAVAARLDGIAVHLEPAERSVALEGLTAWGRALDRARAALLADVAEGSDGR